MPLLLALSQDPEGLAWSCGDEQASGAGVLEIARPGLRLLSAVMVNVDGSPMVPRLVFHDWVFQCAERLLQAYVGYGQLQPHESDWLSHGLAFIKVSAAPPGEDAEGIRDSALMLLGSLNVASRLRAGNPAEMGDVYGWAVEALSWATKRYVRDRRCDAEPPSLCRKAIEIHAGVAEHRGGDPAAAREAERQAQVRTLVACWREEVGARGTARVVDH
ncbi:Hypothetical protein CAP_4527 [Chondromyces apiculatus DSM 436]|uniref:Uncharacterized protein n=1 Tax=Chondromyces apiculatus DSM 436 TaxID=1192034 RepID=A0A017T537_9BACT|nr:Hypothetical protein CAP_4527 [Chondromyces apiculatus DSM 436]